MSSEFAAEVGKRPRRQSEEVSISGAYYVTKNDTSPEEGFRFELTEVKTEKTIMASADRIALGDEQIAIIRDAEYGKRAFIVEISAKKLGSKLVDAKIVRASAIDPSLV